MNKKATCTPEQPQLAPPYVIAYNKLKAFFEGDPAYQISELSDDSQTCTITTDNRLKYLLLKENLITDYQDAKGLHVDLKYIGADKMYPDELAAIVRTNPRFQEFFETSGGPFPYSSVIFTKDVVQYYNDNLFDPYSHASTLMEQLVPEIFKNKCFCTTADE